MFAISRSPHQDRKRRAKSALRCAIADAVLQICESVPECGELPALLGVACRQRWLRARHEREQSQIISPKK